MTARQRHQPHAGHLRNLLRHAGFNHVFHLGHRHGGGGDGKGHDRRIRRVDLAVNRWIRQVRRQQVSGGVNRGLHLLLSDVQRQRELELKRDDRSATGALGRHLLQARHLAKLTLQRGGDGRRHHIRTGARIEGDNLNGRVVHFRQRRHGQKTVANDPGQQDRHHQQGRRNRT